MNSKKKYVIITPARDEEKYIEKTILSVASQTVRSTEWIIVNDGSSDNTGEIIDRYPNEYNWIKVVHRKNRGFRKAGGGVIEAFYEGYNCIESDNWEFIVKLDGDLSFDSDYFEKCFQEFDKNTKLGIGGGIISNLINGKFVVDEKNPIFHVRGATKIYKRDCWEAIGGLIKAPGWDTLDEVKANMLGWDTKSFSEYEVKHYRPTGAADGTWSNWVKNGLGGYISGYHPLFMFVKCIKRLFQKPYIIMSIGLFYGFLSGYSKKVSQINDKPLINYLRKQQLRRLLGKKSIWR